MASRTNKRRRDSSSEQALPTNEDWTFRVKVISSATDLQSDVFKEAIRGLVRICFPDGILEQLGQKVVERHMLEHNARPANIRRMSDVFNSEMIQRLTSILSGFDTRGQVGSAVQSALEGRQDTRSSDNTVSQEPPPRKKTKPNKSPERREPAPVRIQAANQNDAQLDTAAPVTQMEEAVSTPNAVQHRHKDKKISSTWAWNIDPTGFNDQAISSIFPRTADLFAFHALPIVKQKLGSNASRKYLRHEMQSILDALSQEEFAHWIRSLEKLINGDRTMLVRSEPPHTADNLPRMTPAPGRSKTGAGTILGENPVIKSEATEGSVSRNQTKSAVAQGTMASQCLSTQPHESDPPAFSVNVAVRENNSDTHIIENIDSAFNMPVLDLLWGTKSLSPERCANDSSNITETIMENLHRRIAAERIATHSLSGGHRTFTKSELRSRILQSFSKLGRPFSCMGIKKHIEAALVHWVIAEPKAFPELKAMPFLFGYILPSISAMTNILFGSWSVVSDLNGTQLWETMLEALQRRGVTEVSIGVANIDCLQIDNLCNRQKHTESTRRALFERVLRRLAFVYRDKFPELKATPVVKAWEQKTGLKW